MIFYRAIQLNTKTEPLLRSLLNSTEFSLLEDEKNLAGPSASDIYYVLVKEIENGEMFVSVLTKETFDLGYKLMLPEQDDAFAPVETR